MTLEERVPLAPYTTFGVGGSARFFTRVRSVDELHEALTFGCAQHQRLLVLGGGSNMLIADEGFDGLVIKVELKGIEFEKKRDTVLAIAAAGESWDGFVARTVAEGLWGLENLSGIPGTVGGAAQGNIGAYGQALSQTCQWVEVFDGEVGSVVRIPAAECAFDYRDSRFKHDTGRYVIVRAAFALAKEPHPELYYKDLRERFGEDPAPALTDIREAVLAIRHAKFPDLSVEGTAGSFFKNPILPQAEVEALAQHYPGLPLFPMPETPGRTKVAIAWLLDHVLKLHGTHIGDARLFEKQILVIVARKGGRARDVRALMQLVQAQVRERFGIELEPEVQIVS